MRGERRASGIEDVTGLPEFEADLPGCVAPRPRHDRLVHHRRRFAGAAVRLRAVPRDPNAPTRAAIRGRSPASRPFPMPVPGQEDPS